MKKINRIICVLVFIFTAGITQAQIKVVVIPMMGGDAENLKNVITVALENGDFTNPVAAMDSIPTSGSGMPSSTNRYLVVIGPGVYNVGSSQIVMKEWVSITGSGREATKITGAKSGNNLGSSSALVVGASNAALTDLSVENTGTGENTFAIFSFQSSPRLERLIAHAEGGSVTNIGIRIEEGASVVITDVQTTGVGGISAIGLAVHKVYSALNDITAIGKSSSGGNQGVYMTFSSPIMENLTAKAYGGSGSPIVQAMYISRSSPVISNLHATGGSAKEVGYGVYIVFSSAPFIRNSILYGSTDGLWLQDDTTSGTRVVNSRIDNGVHNAATGIQCRGTYDVNLGGIGC